MPVTRPTSFCEASKSKMEENIMLMLGVLKMLGTSSKHILPNGGEKW